jgi:putative oxidoreductase
MDRLERLFKNHTQKIFSVSRILIGFLFLSHGAQKLFDAFGGQGTYGQPIMLFAGIIEFFGGLLFCLGFKTRYVAVIASIEMLYAYFTVHQPRALWPIENKGELALLYFCFFLISIPIGSGTWSLDSLLSKKS